MLWRNPPTAIAAILPLLMLEVRTEGDFDAVDGASAKLFSEGACFHVLDLLHLLEEMLPFACGG